MAERVKSTLPSEGWLQAENAVIGSLLLDESLAAPILATVDVADFSDKGNRRIYQAARALLQEGKPVDPVTLRGKLGSAADARMVQLIELTPTAANWREYAKIMHEQATLLRIQATAEELTEAVTVEDSRELIAKLLSLSATGEGVEA